MRLVVHTAMSSSSSISSNSSSGSIGWCTFSKIIFCKVAYRQLIGVVVILITILWQIVSRVCWCKNLKNRTKFGRDMMNNAWNTVHLIVVVLLLLLTDVTMATMMSVM